MDKPVRSVGIIDDDPIYQFTAKKILQLSKQAGEIQQYTSGDDALEFIRNNSDKHEKIPDILLLDLNMPVTDGWMFLDSFRKIKSTISKEIVIYLVTSSIDPRDIAQSKSYSEIKGFISKPLDIELIKEILTTSHTVA